jgi:2-methylisocitrate lyase-like PEP mutase family enzyme
MLSSYRSVRRLLCFYHPRRKRRRKEKGRRGGKDSNTQPQPLYETRPTNSSQVYLERIRSAVQARTDPDFLIIARTDARNATSYGGDQASNEAFNEGVKRLKEAMAAGADMAFMESPRTKEEMRTLVKELAPHPVLINVLPDVRFPFPQVDCVGLWTDC